MKKLLIILFVVALVVTIAYYGFVYYRNTSDARFQELLKKISETRPAQNATVVNRYIFTSPKAVNNDVQLAVDSTMTEEVKVLQRMLGVNVDGIFGPKTDAALFSKFGVHSISINEANAKLQKQFETQNSSNGKIVDSAGVEIKNGYECWTTSPQVIYRLSPIKNPYDDSLLKYDNFRVGQEYMAGANFFLGYIFDHTSGVVLCVRRGNKYGVSPFDTGSYFFAYNKQIAVRPAQ